MEIFEIEKVQLAKSVAGIVSDPSGSALPGVTVEDRSEDWKTVLRSTETDEKGRFAFFTDTQENSVSPSIRTFWVQLGLDYSETRQEGGSFHHG